jgi:hypothetical protein
MLLRSTKDMTLLALALLRRAAGPGAACAARRAASHGVSASVTVSPISSTAWELQRLTERCASGAAASSSGGGTPGLLAGRLQRPQRAATSRRGLMQDVAAAQQQAVQAADGPALTLRQRLDKMPTGQRAKEPLSLKAQILFDSCWKRMEQRLSNVRGWMMRRQRCLIRVAAAPTNFEPRAVRRCLAPHPLPPLSPVSVCSRTCVRGRLCGLTARPAPARAPTCRSS